MTAPQDHDRARQRFARIKRCASQLGSEPEAVESFSTSFYQSCPTCGRKLKIDVQHVGQRVYCNHCRCAFVARDEVHGRRFDGRAGAPSALERAEQLLALLESRPRGRLCRK